MLDGPAALRVLRLPPVVHGDQGKVAHKARCRGRVSQRPLRLLQHLPPCLRVQPLVGGHRRGQLATKLGHRQAGQAQQRLHVLRLAGGAAHSLVQAVEQL